MSFLFEGELKADWFERCISDGEYIRHDSQFQQWITPDGNPGPNGAKAYPAEKGRYHLYISHACPWCHRTLIYLYLKGLQNYIDVSIVHPHMGEKGWQFSEYPGSTLDKLNNTQYVYELYLKSMPKYSGVITVPILWDSKNNIIVNNESSQIIRILNSSFNHLTGNTLDLFPPKKRQAIDAINLKIYNRVNNGVYKTGFATDQTVYEKHLRHLFETLDELEDLLGEQKYLVGNEITEADIRLFPTLFRFDSTYYFHFNCNIKRLQDYPNLWDYTRALYQYENIRETCHTDHIKHHYFTSHPDINPLGIIPVGPKLDFEEKSSR